MVAGGESIEPPVSDEWEQEPWRGERRKKDVSPREGSSAGDTVPGAARCALAPGYRPAALRGAL